MIHRSVVEHRPVGLFLISNSLGRDQDTSLSFDERLDNLGLPRPTLDPSFLTIIIDFVVMWKEDVTTLVCRRLKPFLPSWASLPSW